MDKKKVWDAAVESHQVVIDDLHTTIKEMEGSVSDIGESTYDHATLAQKSATYEVADTIKAQMEFAKQEMELMNTIDTEEQHDTVQLGSVIKTDKRTFYLSVSIEEFEVGKEEFFGLSLKSPLGKAMLGKKVGDSFSYNETTYKISEIY